MYAKSTRPSAKREVQKERSAKRDDRIARPRRAQTCEWSELRAKRAMRMCPRSGQIFSFKIEFCDINLQIRILVQILVNLGILKLFKWRKLLVASIYLTWVCKIDAILLETFCRHSVLACKLSFSTQFHCSIYITYMLFY